MGRGLGPRQLAIIERLTEVGHSLFVSDFMKDPEDQAERRLVLSAIRGLKRRDLVDTFRTGNPDRISYEYRASVKLDDNQNAIKAMIYDVDREINEQRVYLVNKASGPDVRTIEQRLADIAALPAPPKA